MNRSLGNLEEKKIRGEIQALLQKHKNAELGMIWIFDKPEKKGELIRPQSTLLLVQWAFQGPNYKQNRTVGYRFFNPTDLEFDSAKEMLVMINSELKTPNVFKYRIEKWTMNIQKSINEMVDNIKSNSNDKASQKARAVLDSLKDETLEHGWDAEIIRDIYTKVGLSLKNDEIIQEIIATGYALGHYLAFLYTNIFEKKQNFGESSRDSNMRNEMQAIYDDFTSGLIVEERVKMMKWSKDLKELEEQTQRMAGGGRSEETEEDGEASFDISTETLSYLLDQLRLDGSAGGSA